MLISVNFWKSMHGYAMDSRTREPEKDCYCADSYVVLILSIRSVTGTGHDNSTLPKEKRTKN